MKKSTKWRLIAICIAVGAFLLDQITKIVAASTKVNVPIFGDWLWLKYIQNPGVAFGMKLDGIGFTWAIVIFSALATAVLIFVFVKYAKSPFLQCALLLLASGAAGNLVDRVLMLLSHSVESLASFSGGVRDFIYVSWFANFNVADIAVTFGVILLVIYLLFFDKNGIFVKKKEKTEEKPQE